MVIKLNIKFIIAVFLSVCIIVASFSILKNNSPSTHTVIAIDNDSVCVPIIMYHEVKTSKAGKDAITPYEFESDLKYLKANNYTTITMSDLINYVDNGKSLPEKPIILSFDDGYLNNYVYVFPLLKKYNMKIVLSIIGKDTDDFTTIKDENINYSHVTWSEINEMLSSKYVEIQNHTYNMHTITKKRCGCKKNPGETQAHYAEALTSDIEKLQNEIMFYTGYTPNTFTYPYGFVSSDSLPIIKSMGFKATLTCDYGVNIITKDPDSLFGLKRICRSHGFPVQKAIIQGMETLKYRKID